MNLSDLFARARQGLALTPGERAFLKFVQGAVISALTAGFWAACQAVQPNPNWWSILWVGAIATIVSFGHALAKYFTAQGDAPVASAVTQLTNQAVGWAEGEQQAGPPALFGSKPMAAGAK